MFIYKLIVHNILRVLNILYYYLFIIINIVTYNK